MAKRIFALLSLVGLVVLAGCIGEFGNITEIFPGVVTGVSITSFGPDIPEVFSGDDVIFTVEVENVGEIEATNVSAKLMGLGTDWSGTDWATVANREQSIGDLTPAQPSLGVPGGQDSATWDTTSPSGLRVDKVYTAKVRIFYTYETQAVGSVKVYNQDYLGTLPPGEATAIRRASGLESWTTTKSPINVELAGASRPFVVREGDTLDGTISVLISNRGQGYPYTEADDTSRKITIDSISVGIDSDGNPKKCTNWDEIDKTPTLPRTGRKGVSCKFAISSTDVPDFTTVPIKVELSYKYYMDSSSTVKILQTLA